MAAAAPLTAAQGVTEADELRMAIEDIDAALKENRDFGPNYSDTELTEIAALRERFAARLRSTDTKEKT